MRVGGLTCSRASRELTTGRDDSSGQPVLACLLRAGETSLVLGWVVMYPSESAAGDERYTSFSPWCAAEGCASHRSSRHRRLQVRCLLSRRIVSHEDERPSFVGAVWLAIVKGSLAKPSHAASSKRA